ncbi:hypothetical protein CB1_001794001, partial [Camelus ferus]
VSVPGVLSWRVHPPIQALEAVNRWLWELYPKSEVVLDIVFVTNNHTQALEAVNRWLWELYPKSEVVLDIVFVTNNHTQVGIRLINSINHHGEHEGSGQ